MPLPKTTFTPLFFFVLLLLFAVNTKASTWIDPYWNEGISKASLVATATVKDVAEDHLLVVLEQVYKGSAAAKQVIEVLLESSDHEHSEAKYKEGTKLLLVLHFDKEAQKYVAFTPSFGLYPFRDAVVWLPLKDPVQYTAVTRLLCDQLIRFGLQGGTALADSLRHTAAATLKGQDPFSKDETALEQQNLMLQLLARCARETDIPLIEPFLKSPYWTIRASAVQAMRAIKSPKAIPLLTALISNEPASQVLSLAAEALWQSGGAKSTELEQLVAKVSSEDVPLASNIMNPVFNTIAAPRYALAAVLMRYEGNKGTYEQMVADAPAWLAKHPRIYISPLETAETYYNLDDARKMPVDSVLILNFSTKTFSEFPAEVFRYRKLRALSMSGCPVKSLPDSLDLLSDLESLSIDGRQMTQLPAALFRLKNLRRLFLNDMKLDSFPSAIGELTQLEELRYGGKKVNLLPESMGQLKALRTLNLRMSGIDSLPASVATLPSLKEVEMYGCKLQHIPEPLLHNASVTSLEIGSNDISSIPADLSDMKSLKYIDLSYNPLPLRERARIDSSYKGIVINTETYENRVYSIEDALEHPELAGSVQPGASDLGSRTDIDYGLLTQTNYLVLTRNNFKSFPEGVCRLTGLRGLGLDNNYIKEIPACIASMKGLKNLYLGSNEITSLPAAMALMDQLEALYLSNNKLTDLPEWIGKLKNLKELSLSGNPIPAENKAKIKSWFADRKILLFLD